MSNKSAIEENRIIQFIVSPKARVYRHLFLILFLVLVLSNTRPHFIESALIYSRAVSVFLFLLLVYINMYWLAPKLLFKNRYAAYGVAVVSVILLSAVVYLGSMTLFAPFIRPDLEKEEFNLLTFSFAIVIFISASTSIKLFQRSIRDNRRISDLETTTLKSEMEQLKNQINPHFLLNMLNNVNVLTQKDPEKASQVIMKLSDLLRYQLYDSARTSVLLTSEIRFLEDFLNLENVRRDNFESRISKEGELSGVQIAPLLLITFVENAVKHNMDAEKRSYIHLEFNVANGELFFRCVNSKPQIAVKKNGHGGLGLANVKRRLELIYPKRHTLRTENSNDTYIVTLTISL